MDNTEFLKMVDEIKMKLLTRFSIALEKELSAETLGMIGEVVADFESNEIKRTNSFSIENVKDDLLDIISMIPTSNDTSFQPNKKEVL